MSKRAELLHPPQILLDDSVLRKNTAVLFNGQGIQYPGMGKDLYKSNPTARSIFDIADRITQGESNFSIWDIMSNGPKNLLDNTRYAQVAILAWNIAHFEAFKEAMGDSYVPPIVVGGYSSGQNAGIVIGGGIDYESAVRIVNKRSPAMQEVFEGLEGSGLLRVRIRLGEDGIPTPEQELLYATSVSVLRRKKIGLHLGYFIDDTDMVFGGKREALQKAKEWFEANKHLEKAGIQQVGIEAIPSHTPLMRKAVPPVRRALREVVLRDLQIPLIANSTGLPIYLASEIIPEFEAHLINPILWYKSIATMFDMGVENIIEIGERVRISALTRRQAQIRKREEQIIAQIVDKRGIGGTVFGNILMSRSALKQAA